MPSSHDWRHPLKRWWDTSPIPLEPRGGVGLHHWYWLQSRDSSITVRMGLGSAVRVACQHRLAAAVESGPDAHADRPIGIQIARGSLRHARRLGADPEGLVF